MPSSTPAIPLSARRRQLLLQYLSADTALFQSSQSSSACFSCFSPSPPLLRCPSSLTFSFPAAPSMGREDGEGEGDHDGGSDAGGRGRAGRTLFQLDRSVRRPSPLSPSWATSPSSFPLAAAAAAARLSPCRARERRESCCSLPPLGPARRRRGTDGSGSLPRTRAPSGLPPLRRGFSLSSLSAFRSRRAGFSALPARGPHGRPRGLHLQVHARSGALLKYYIMGSHIEMFSEFKLAERLRCSPFSPFLRLHFQRQKKRFRTTRHNCFAIIDDTPEMRSGFRTSTRFSLLRR